MAKNPDGYFEVDWTNNLLSENPPTSSWDTKEEAMAEAQDKLDAEFKYIWVGQWSDNRNEWLFFWWTIKTEWGELPPTGRGRRAPCGENFVI